MSFCTNCGQSCARTANYCANCGLNLSTSSGPPASDKAIETAYYNAAIAVDETRRRTRANRAAANEGLDIFLTCLGVVAFFHGLALMLGDAFARILSGPLLWLLAGGLLVGAGLKLFFDRRSGRSIARSLVETFVIGGVLYGTIVGLFWYLGESFIRSGRPLFNFAPLPTPTPATLLSLFLT